MPKKPSGKDYNLNSPQMDCPANVCSEDINQMVEMAAEQLADLLWRHWLYMKSQEKKRSRGSDS